MDQTLIQALLHPSMYVTINITLFICAILVLMMQPGFMMLETGSVSRKNAINNVFKNFLDMCLCGLCFWWVGYDIIAGQSPVNDVLASIGLTHERYATPPSILPAEPISIFFQMVFASTAVTITSGCITGRVRPFHYIVYSIVFATFIYPIIAFLVWNPAGVLYGVFTDFAGSVVVHAVGGFAGLAGAILLRPRIGYYRHGEKDYGAEVVDALADSHQPHNLPLAALGVFFLWIGWYGFNAGTLFSAGVPEFTEIDGLDIISALAPLFETFGKIVANTTFGPCAGAIAITFVLLALREELDILTILNGAIAGLVGITASADIASSLGATIIGAVCGLSFIFARYVLDRLFIDDPVGAFAAHGFPGIIGVAAVPFFQDGPLLEGVIWQVCFALLIVSFSFLSAMVVFIFSRFILAILYKVGLIRGEFAAGYQGNYLRVAPEIELEGLDQYLHGRDAYNVYENS